MASQLHGVGANVAEGLVSDGNDGRHTAQIAGLAIEHHHRIVIAFVGMAFEARIAAGPGVLVVCRSARCELATVAESAVRHGYRGIISFGVAGGLASGLRAGDWVVASAVRDSQTIRPTDAAWSRRLLEVITGASHAPIMGVDTPIAECRRRDPKGLYEKADSGLIRNFTGIDAPYEEPLEPEIRLRTLEGTADVLADEVVTALRTRGTIA